MWHSDADPLRFAIPVVFTCSLHDFIIPLKRTFAFRYSVMSSRRRLFDLSSGSICGIEFAPRLVTTEIAEQAPSRDQSGCAFPGARARLIRLPVVVYR